jgi:cell division septum initiation protein DivIVA
MSEQGHLSADLGHEDQFEREMRGYSRRAVDEYVAALRIDLRTLEDGKRDLENRLSQALDDLERLKLELSAARSNGKPAHEEISERIGQILKLADDEAKSQRVKAEEEITKLRTDAQTESAKLRADAKAETDRSRAEAQQVVSEATRQAETAVATAKSQAKQQLDEATARATAIHDGAERRLNLLMSRHTEAVRRLTEIRDVVTSLVAGEADRGSLEDEVARIVTGAAGDGQPARPANGRSAGSAEGRHAGGNGQPGAQPALSTAHRPGVGSPPAGRLTAPGANALHAIDSRNGGTVGARPDGDETADGIKAIKD